MWQNFSKDAVVSQRGCLLRQVVVSPDYGKTAWVTFYDGDNTGGRKIFSVYTPMYATRPFRFDPPLRCEEGLYLNIVENCKDVLVIWEGLEGV